MRLCPILCAIPLALLTQPAMAQCGIGKALEKTEWSIGYNAGIPLGEMGTYANTAHGFALRGFYRVPASHGRVNVGLEVITGSYASFTRTQNFGMNGVETPTDVTYNSNVTTTSAVFRYNYLRTKTLNVFAAVKGGFAGFNSKIMIEDPNDPDGCEPLDKKNLISDYTWTGGIQTGANLDMQHFFKKLPAQTLLLETYVGYLQGGNVDYINVKNTTSDNHTSHNHAAATPDGGRSLDVRFINLQTGAQHSHEVARVYNSPVQFLECGLSLVVRF